MTSSGWSRATKRWWAPTPLERGIRLADVLIKRCRLCIVRRGGWSWGPNPEALLRTVISALPALLAALIEEMCPGETDLEISAPVRLCVPMQLEELLAGAVLSTPSPGAELPPAVAQRVKTALVAAIVPTLPAVFTRVGGSPPASSASIPRVAVEVPTLGVELTLARLLLRWRERGTLAPLLACFTATAVEEWHRALHRRDHTPGDRRGVPPSASLTEEIASLVERASVARLDRTGRLRVRIHMAVEVASRLAIEPSDPMLWAALDLALPVNAPRPGGILAVPSESAPSAPAPSAAGPAATSSPWFSPHPRTATAAISPETRTAIQISAALPFLLLGPLGRIGYWETLAAVVEAGGLAADLPLFAVALAFKVLDPPRRGWDRQRVAPVAAAFAGLAGEVPEAQLVSFSDRIGRSLSPLDAVLQQSLADGHTPGSPLLLQHTGGGFLLAEAEGLRSPSLGRTSQRPCIPWSVASVPSRF